MRETTGIRLEHTAESEEGRTMLAERTLEGATGWTCRDGRAPTPYTPAELVAVWRTMQWHDSGSTIARLVATVFEADYRWSDAITHEMCEITRALGLVCDECGKVHG